MKRVFSEIKRGLTKVLGDSSITLVLIPETTKQVHKLVVPLAALKMALLVVSASVLFFIFVGLDYASLIGNLSENKTLKSENLKLRTDMLEIRSKIEAMESTVERVRDYAKKLQLLTGQPQKGAAPLPWDNKDFPADEKQSRNETGNREKVKTVAFDESEPLSFDGLGLRIEELKSKSLKAETNISKVHISLQEKQFLVRATPSLIPIRGRISSPFGYRRNPVNSSFRLHAGIDIVAKPGTPVVAPADGRVIFSGDRAGYGKVVVLDHSFGIQTVFAHNSKLFAPLGALIKRGEVIAQVGSTGHSTGPHLHYEVRKNGAPVDPAPYFSPIKKVSKG